jgi:F-type H+-transporting ATPase subunit b
MTVFTLNILAVDLGLFFWTSVLFLVFFLILRRFAWKPILNALKEREDTIENSLLQAEKAREEMSRLKSENEALLKEARQERDKMIAEANKMRDQIITKARTEAQEEAGKEMDKAKAQIEAEKKAALAEIKNTTGALAVKVAEKLLRKQFEKPETQRELADKLIADLSNN